MPSWLINILSQAYDTLLAICRETAYPQLWWSNSLGRYFNPPPLGQCLLLLAYWAMLLIFLWSDVILPPSSDIYAYKWEIVAFRAAWVSVTQVPLIYCLSAKHNPISFLTGISYERLNWLHRWTARTLFLTVIVHWSFFFREWWLANFVQLELQMMQMVRYGFGAWAVMGWMVLTGFGFFRSASYEIFFMQHIMAAAALLVLLYKHVPAYASYNVWLSIGFVALDRVIRTTEMAIKNLHLRSATHDMKSLKSFWGFPLRIEPLGNEYMSLVLEDVDFNWKPGQHLFISVPCCGPLQSHPFTIANAPWVDVDGRSRCARFVVKVHSGFTRRLHRYSQAHFDRPLRAFAFGPFGNPPLDIIGRSDSLILIATSTGASFTIPILQHVIEKKPQAIRRLCFYWIVRQQSQLEWFGQELTQLCEQGRTLEMDLKIQLFVTSLVDEQALADIPRPVVRPQKAEVTSTSCASTTTTEYDSDREVATESFQMLPILRPEVEPITEVGSSSSTAPDTTPLPTLSGRPTNIKSLILPTIETAEGETAILACGNPGYMAEIRNYVAWLSDKRAVHKGSGAQGIYLWTETYGW